MPPEITIDTVNQAIGELRRAHEDYQKGVLTKADFTATETKIWDKINAIDAEAKKAALLEARIAELETKLARPGLGGPEPAKGPSPEHKAFMTFMRRGEAGIGPDEKKVMRIADDTTGGYLTSSDIEQGIMKDIVLFSPIRSLAKVRTTSKGEVQFRKRTGTFAARHRGESGTRSETTGLKYGLERIPVHELYADVAWTTQDLEDSDFNLEAETAMEASEQFGVAEGTDFVSGNGKEKAEGFLVNPAVVAAKIPGDTAGDLSVTDILNTFYGLPEVYAAQGSWLFRRATTQKVVLFKDAANHYIWMPSLVSSMPQTLLGRPIVECPDMPAVGSSAYAVAFGDFRRGYQIVDRMGISTLRDPFTLKNNGQVEFTYTKRVGGAVIMANAIRILQIHA